MKLSVQFSARDLSKWPKQRWQLHDFRSSKSFMISWADKKIELPWIFSELKIQTLQYVILLQITTNNSFLAFSGTSLEYNACVLECRLYWSLSELVDLFILLHENQTIQRRNSFFFFFFLFSFVVLLSLIWNSQCVAFFSFCKEELFVKRGPLGVAVVFIFHIFAALFPKSDETGSSQFEPLFSLHCKSVHYSYWYTK